MENENQPNFYTEEDIKTLYGVSDFYINKHSKRMGCYCRNPRRFLKEEVIRFFKDKEIEKATFERELNKLFLKIRAEINLKYRRKKAGWRRHTYRRKNGYDRI